MGATGSGPDRGSMLCACKTGNDVTLPRFFLTIVVQNVPLRMTGNNMATGCDVIKRHVTPKSFPLVKYAHARPDIAQYPPYWGLFTGSDLIKRHVTPKGSLGKYGSAHTQPEIAQYPIKSHP